MFSKITQIRHRNDVVEIDVLGLNEHNIYTVDLYRSIEKQHIEIIRKTVVPMNTTYTHLYGNTRACVVLYDEYDYTLQFFNGENMERENLLLPFGMDIYDPGLISSTCIMKDDGTKCLWAMQWMDKFNILDIKNTDKSGSFTTSRKRISDRELFATISEKTPSSVAMFYTTAQVTNDDIYMLYNGFSNDESEGEPRQIQNFSWEGKYKRRFIINEKIDSFIVSNDGTMIYGYSWDELKVYKYLLR